jgi:diguanylate cyclase
VTGDPPASPRRPYPSSVLRLPTALATIMWIVLVAYLVGLVRHGPGFEPLVDGWLGALTDVLPALVCWSAVLTAGVRRREVISMALAVTAFALGDVVYVFSASGDAAVQFPSPADAGFLAFYPLALLAIALAVRRQLRAAGGSVWLDSVLGGVGAVALLAVVLERLFAAGGGSSITDGLALIYPIGDGVLMAAVIGVIGVLGRNAQHQWPPLLAGLMLFTAADVLSALNLADNTYNLGGTVDGFWVLGLALMSYWARGRPAPVASSERPVALVMPVLATAASLVVLVAASRAHVSGLAVGLATLTQLATAARTQVAFQQLRRLADVRRQATTDELTGMANRRAFYAEATTRLARVGPPGPPGGADIVHALLLLDLNRFKEVNDSLGHHVGDQLLIQIGRRLQQELRADDLVARLGGDEFAVLLTADEARAVLVAGKLRAAIANPCLLEGIALRTDASIGIALSPQHGTELSTLLRRADMAMYAAKRAREGHRVFSAVDDTAGAGRLRKLQELHTAMAEDQMTLHYQPKLDLRTGRVRDVEALVRWNHPSRGLLYPDSFLGLVEDGGLMRPLTQLVLRQALDQAAVWQEQGRPMTIAVNLSASSLVDADLPDQVAELLAERGLPAQALQLEITEEFLMADRDRTREIVVRMREKGIQIAVDDFGTGYSSLAYLRELPIDELKLDRSFVFPMADDARAAALVFSTIALAHSLGLRLVAEGVESRAALDELAAHGCDQAQGYHVSRPLPAPELEHWLDGRDQESRSPTVSSRQNSSA